MRHFLKRIIAEPLAVFMALGAGLFALYGLVGADGRATDPKEIVVGRSDLLAHMQYRARAFDSVHFDRIFNDLTDDEREWLIADYVEEEALYREAKALGLDRHDYVARHRLIQRLAFIIQGISETDAVPSPAQIEAYYAANADKYAEPATVTFTHVFFSAERRGMHEAETLARQELQKLNARKIAFEEASAHGDRRLFHVNYVKKEHDLVSSHFSAAMADELFSLTPDSTLWRGPYFSNYGAHLVLLIDRADARTPPLDEVRDRAALSVRREEETNSRNEAIRAIVQTYSVRLRDDAARATEAGS